MNEATGIDVLQRVRSIFEERFPDAMTVALVAKVLTGTGIRYPKVEAAIAELFMAGIIVSYGRTPYGHAVYRGSGKK